MVDLFLHYSSNSDLNSALKWSHHSAPETRAYADKIPVPSSQGFLPPISNYKGKVLSPWEEVTSPPALFLNISCLKNRFCLVERETRRRKESLPINQEPRQM